MTTLPTAAQITSLFLYGTDTPPTGGALASQNLPNHAVGVLPDIDFKEFMETGPGRFANASQSALITQFFLEGGDNPPGRHLQPGESMTAAEFAAATGLELTYQVKQLFYHDANESTLDIASRVYIYNTQEFSINADARFVVDADGTYRIENLRIKAPEFDNFDFVGGSTSSNVANQYLQPRVDPWNIGKVVKLDYSGDFVIGDYSVAQFNNDRDFILDSYAPISTPVITILSGLTDQLFNDGTSRFIDQDGRAIIYSKSLTSQIDVNSISGAFNDRSGDYSFVANRAPLLLDAAQFNGIHWVGDNGVDNVKAGGKDDVLKGYRGNDILEGRGGADTLDGGSGVDRASYESSEEGVTVDLVLGTGIGGDAAGDTLISIENVDGSDFVDKLSGNTVNNVLRGADGNDLLQGLQGADRLYGEDNDDRLVGGEGVDSLYGGNGSDLLILGALEDRPAGSGSGGVAEIADGGAGRDYIVLTDADTDRIVINGGDRGDRLLLMPHLTGGTAKSNGSLPLTTLLGGWSANSIQNMYDYSGGLLSQSPPSNIFVHEDGTRSKSYWYLPASGGGGAFPDNAISGVHYEYFFEKSRLEITVFYTPEGGAEKQLKININSFNLGDYGISFHDYLVSESHFYDDNSGRNHTDEFSGAVVAMDAKAEALRKLANTHTLTQDIELQPQQRMATFAAGIEPVLTAENLVMQLDGSSDNDTLTGIDLREKLFGHDGDDLIKAGGGADTLDGGDGNDVLHGESGDDEIFGGFGDDILAGGSGADVIDGGDGIDTADYRSSSLGVNINLELGTATSGNAESDFLFSIENLVGSAGTDSLSGDAGDNRLTGLGGNDSLSGSSGKDVLIGGEGHDTLSGGDSNDRLVGGEGADLLIGGTGTDTADYRNSSIGVSIDLLNHSASGGDAEGDQLSGIEYLIGSAFGDQMIGDAAINRLVGGEGDDNINGGAGNDYLIGGTGFDILTGGLGQDVFLFEDGAFGSDTIFDFAAGVGRTDRIWLTQQGVSDFASLASHFTQTAGGVNLQLANGSMLLAGLTIAQLVADDFLFS